MSIAHRCLVIGYLRWSLGVRYRPDLVPLFDVSTSFDKIACVHATRKSLRSVLELKGDRSPSFV